MKEIKMNSMRCGCNGWVESEPHIFRRVSKWIKVKHNYNPCSRNALWDYVTDENGYKPYQDAFNPENGLYLDYFRFNGRNYALDQFLALGNPFYTAVTYSYEDENGKTAFLSGVDSEDIYQPIYIEMDSYGEYVRVYKSAHK